MSAPARFTLHLCTGCVPSGSGLVLAEDMAARFAAEAALAGGRIETFACLGGCTARGRASLAAPGHWSWLFGGLGPETAAPLAAFVRAWLAAPDGVVARADRPTALSKTILGRLPPEAPGPTLDTTEREDT